MGPDGFLFAPVAEDLPVQAFGAGVALLLGVGGRLCLGLLSINLTYSFVELTALLIQRHGNLATATGVVVGSHADYIVVCLRA